MAVITLLALITTLVIPQLGWQRDRGVREEALALADLLLVARERALITGRTHRVTLDFGASTRRLEWRPPEDEMESEAPSPGRERVDLEPPRNLTAEFEPVPGGVGNEVETRRGVWLLDLDSSEARNTGDVITLQFGAEGNADPARITLGNDDGEARWVVEIFEFAQDIDVYEDDA